MGHDVRQSVERQSVLAERMLVDAFANVWRPAKVLAVYVFGIVVDECAKYCAEVVEKKLRCDCQ